MKVLRTWLVFFLPILITIPGIVGFAMDEIEPKTDKQSCATNSSFQRMHASQHWFRPLEQHKNSKNRDFVYWANKKQKLYKRISYKNTWLGAIFFSASEQGSGIFTVEKKLKRDQLNI